MRFMNRLPASVTIATSRGIVVYARMRPARLDDRGGNRFAGRPYWTRTSDQRIKRSKSYIF
jgi:hypothetical protein